MGYVTQCDVEPGAMVYCCHHASRRALALQSLVNNSQYGPGAIAFEIAQVIIMTERSN